MIALVIGSALSLVSPWIMQNLVDAVFGRNDVAELNRITLILLATFLANEVRDAPDAMTLPPARGRLTFEVVLFAYSSLTPAPFSRWERGTTACAARRRVHRTVAQRL